MSSNTPEGMRALALLYFQLANSTGLLELADDFRWKARELEARAAMLERQEPVPETRCRN